MDEIAEEFDKLKRSRTAHKGRITSSLNRLDQLSNVETVREDKLSGLMADLDYHISKSLDINQQMEDLLVDSNLSLNENGEHTSYMAEVQDSKAQLMQQELQAESLCAMIKQRNMTQGHAETTLNPVEMGVAQALIGVQSKLAELCATQSQPQSGGPPLKLTGLEPPSWDGEKANFYTWKDMFSHTMSQARITDDQVQITWLLRKGAMPLEYQSVIQDCKSMAGVWERLQKQIPISTVRHEIIRDFEQTPSLPKSSQRNASSMRELANAISLFIRRMEDLDLKQDATSVICLEQACKRLDQETALRYATYCDLGNSQGIVESMESLADFLRSEATTLDRLFHSNQSSNNMKPPRVFLNVLQQETKDTTRAGQSTQLSSNVCILGCESQHRFVDCPKYMQKSVQDRRQFINENQRCFICLGMHLARNCSRRLEDSTCTKCSGRQHHRTLCPVKTTCLSPQLNPTAEVFNTEHVTPSNKIASISGSVSTGKNIRQKLDYSPLVAVDVKSADGVWIRANCFLDMGSDTTLVRKKFANHLGLTILGSSKLRFGTAGGSVHEEHSKDYNLEIRPLGKNSTTYKIVASSVNKPCFDASPIPSFVFDEYEYLKPFSDQIVSYGGPVDLLIGRDYAPYIQTLEVLQAPTEPDKRPSIAFTKLGCYLFGGIVEAPKPRFPKLAKVNFVSKSEDKMLFDFFHCDVLGVKPTKLCSCSDSEISEAAFIKHIKATTTISKEGRVQVRMPWKPGFPEALPNNYDRAFAQMERREKQLLNNGKMEEYNQEIQNLLDRGVVRVLDLKEAVLAKQEEAWYLNHKIVERPDKSSTKLRVVFDSASPYKGVCLNDALEKGPNFTNSLFRCFLGWREERIAVTGDISKMFNQIEMTEEDQKFHRFLWRFGDLNCFQPSVFQWLRVLFGDTCSPDIAMFAIRMLGDIHKNEYPDGAEVLKKNIYIDDIGKSVPDLVKAKQTISEVDDILASGKFTIKTWNSNHEAVDKNLEEKVVDFLGHLWDKSKDTFRGKPKMLVSHMKLSKRTVLGLVMKLWDPIGFLLPVTMQYRIDLQAIWGAGYKWDDLLSHDYVKVWQRNVEEMNKLAEVELDRCLKPPTAIGNPQLHAFSDGGDQGFGTCIFLRWETSEGVKLTFVTSKAFVAPLKHKSIPKKELMGAIAMSRLVEEVTKALEYSFEFKRFWIDSKVVIHWLRSQSSRFIPFVATRIQEFQDTHTKVEEELRYVPTKFNPADSLTKPISVEALKAWHQGPDFLRQPESLWPQLVDDLGPDIEIFGKPKPKAKKYQRTKKILALDTEKERDFGSRLIEEFSSWMELLKVIAWAKVMLQRKTFSKYELSSGDIFEELNAAKQVLFKLCQAPFRENIQETRRRYFKLDIKIDALGVLRSGGRLTRTDLPDEIKHPIILPGQNQLVRLLADYYHQKFKHQGYRVVIANLRQEGVLIAGGRVLLKSVASRCVFCRIRRRKLLQQRMGELPSFRVQPRIAPFTSVAMDFFGHLKVKQSRYVSVDGSVLIITCATTRSIHLELCLALDKLFPASFEKIHDLSWCSPISDFF